MRLLNSYKGLPFSIKMKYNYSENYLHGACVCVLPDAKPPIYEGQCRNGDKFMNESYAEASVKQKASPVNLLIKVLLIAVTLFFLVFGMGFLGAFAIVGVGVMILVCVIVFPYLSVEVEYVFCDGQLDFDKIYSGNKRKTALRIDFENVEQMAPAGSHALDAYQNNSGVKTMDFTSRERDIHPYVIIVRQGEQLTRLLFEPSEKMIAAIKQKAPRKVSEY